MNAKQCVSLPWRSQLLGSTARGGGGARFTLAQAAQGRDHGATTAGIGRMSVHTSRGYIYAQYFD
jgi:hypothetical protein